MSARGRWFARGVAAAVAAGLLAACGASDDRGGASPSLTWYVGPDRVDAAALAQACTTSSGGTYAIQVEQLPTDVTARHDLLVRRLLAEDSSIDLLSVDTSMTPELAAAGFFAPVPASRVDALKAGIVPQALATATYRGRLVAAPWWLDPQRLWFRGNAAERAGLDTTKPISWDDLLAGAKRLGVSVEVDDQDGSGVSEWVSGLVTGAGGTVVDGAGRSAKVGLSSDAGRAAASVVELYDEQGAGAGPSADALRQFASPTGGFLLAPSSVIVDPALAAISADMRAASYPVLGNTSVAPLAGVNLAVPAHAPRPSLSYDAISCLTSPAILRTIMTSARHSASRLSTYDNASVTSAIPDAAAIRAAVTSGRTVPVTPYWPLVLAALDESWLPIDDVTQDSTPDDSQRAVRAALEGRLG